MSEVSVSVLPCQARCTHLVSIGNRSSIVKPPCVRSYRCLRNVALGPLPVPCQASAGSLAVPLPGPLPGRWDQAGSQAAFSGNDSGEVTGEVAGEPTRIVVCQAFPVCLPFASPVRFCSACLVRACNESVTSLYIEFIRLCNEFVTFFNKSRNIARPGIPSARLWRHPVPRLLPGICQASAGPVAVPLPGPLPGFCRASARTPAGPLRLQAGFHDLLAHRAVPLPVAF